MVAELVLLLGLGP